MNNLVEESAKQAALRRLIEREHAECFSVLTDIFTFGASNDDIMNLYSLMLTVLEKYREWGYIEQDLYDRCLEEQWSVLDARTKNEVPQKLLKYLDGTRLEFRRQALAKLGLDQNHFLHLINPYATPE